MSRRELQHLHSPRSSEQNLSWDFLLVLRKTNLQIVNEGDIPWGLDSFTERNSSIFYSWNNGVKQNYHQKLRVFLPVDLNWMASRVTRRPSFKLTLDLTLRKYKSGQLTICFTRIGTKAKQLLEDFLVESTLLGNEALGTVSWEKKEVRFWSKKGVFFFQTDFQVLNFNIGKKL